MIIALDYDGTYNQDKAMWDDFISDARSRGHTIYIVTMRHPDARERAALIADNLQHKANYMYFTSREAKKPYMLRQGVRIDIWIDDDPDAILFDKDS